MNSEPGPSLNAQYQSAKQPVVVWVLFFATIISFMGLGLVDPILPAITQQLDATPSQVSLLFSSYNLITGIALLITGVVSSRIGIKWTLLTGILFIIVFSTLAGSSNGIWQIVSFPASAAYSFVRFIGGAVGPWLATKLAEAYSSAVPFYTGAVFLFLGVLVVAFGRKHIAHVDQISGH